MRNGKVPGKRQMSQIGSMIITLIDLYCIIHAIFFMREISLKKCWCWHFWFDRRKCNGIIGNVLRCYTPPKFAYLNSFHSFTAVLFFLSKFSLKTKQFSFAEWMIRLNKAKAYGKTSLHTFQKAMLILFFIIILRQKWWALLIGYAWRFPSYSC